VPAVDLRSHLRLVLIGAPGTASTLELYDVPRLLALRAATDADVSRTLRGKGAARAARGRPSPMRTEVKLPQLEKDVTKHKDNRA